MAVKGCLVCGSEIIYSEKDMGQTCSICGKDFKSNAVCSKGHFICDSCHSGGSVSVIKQICKETESICPRGIAIQIMNSPTVHMHGPEHHIIIGSALAAAYKNAGGDVDLDKVLEIIAERGGKVPGGVCGNWGSCGAGIGAGIFLSAVLGASPMSEESWGLCNLITAKCLNAVGVIGGPRCCKRNVGTAINTAVDFVKDNFGIAMEKDETSCGFSNRNRDCLSGKCPFFGGADNGK